MAPSAAQHVKHDPSKDREEESQEAEIRGMWHVFHREIGDNQMFEIAKKVQHIR